MSISQRATCLVGLLTTNAPATISGESTFHVQSITSWIQDRSQKLHENLLKMTHKVFADVLDF